MEISAQIDDLIRNKTKDYQGHDICKLIRSLQLTMQQVENLVI